MPPVHPGITMSESAFRQLIRRYVTAELAQFLEMTTIARSSEDDDERQDVVRLYEDPDGEPGTIDLARFEGWGDIGIPPNDEPAIIVRRGDQGVLFPITSNRFRPTGYKRGDRVIFSNALGTKVVLRGDSDSATAGQVEVQTPIGAKIIIDKDGNVDAESSGGAKAHLDQAGSVAVDAAPGQDVVVNGGAAKVARDGENVAPTATMQKFLAKTILLLNAAAPGTITVDEAAELAAIIGNVDGGAANFTTA